MPKRHLHHRMHGACAATAAEDEKELEEREAEREFTKKKL